MIKRSFGGGLLDETRPTDQPDLLSVEPDFAAADYAACGIGRNVESELLSAQRSDTPEDQNGERDTDHDDERRETDAQLSPTKAVRHDSDELGKARTTAIGCECWKRRQGRRTSVRPCFSPCARRGSNPQPPPPEGGALSN